MCKHQQRLELDVHCSALVHNFNNIFSNGHLYQTGQLMNSLSLQILERKSPPKMQPSITSDQIDKCIKSKVWDLSNKVLYDLCATNFTHDTDEKVIAKTLLIGRTYAAAIERRKNKKDINDNFYIDIVAPTFKNSRLDTILTELKQINNLSVDTLPKIIDAHFYLTKTLFEITNLDKRSFSSKYLHFHLPQLFFIYDSRAVIAMRHFLSRLPKQLKALADRQNIDKEYSHFFYKCFHLRQTINEQHNILLTPRHLDNLLIETANNKILTIVNSK